MPKTLPNRIGQILMLMTRDFQQRLDADLVARGIVGIGQRHRAVFLYLGQNGASRSVELAEAAGIRPQSMMVIIHELEGLGLIERRPDPSDSRAKLIDFTTAGQTFIDELTESTEGVWQQYADIVGKKELTTLFDGLQSLLNDTGRTEL
jgi:MarR family transcriptional regulator for hemolysin